MANSLAIATLAIFAVLILPVFFLLAKHARYGLAGWLFLSFFCAIQIVGGGLAINSSGPAASIVSNVGLSPLLLGTAGILHEARIFRIPNLDKKLEWLIQLVFHMLVVGGLALTVVGTVKLQNHEQPIDKAEKITKAGISIMAVSWGVLVGLTGVSFMGPRAKNDSPVARAGTTLLASVCFSLVFIGVRVFYSVAALTSQKASLNPTTGSLALRVVLGFLPGLITTLAYICAGIKTQGVAKLAGDEPHDISPSRKPRPAPYV
ncbi:hypothetical protein FQN54_000602 [Arachnomyces sp. PD_36]|nr:hypothetical protein FQN54_000602 [Arachnomyces sp. PD_36]